MYNMYICNAGVCVHVPDVCVCACVLYVHVYVCHVYCVCIYMCVYGVFTYICGLNNRTAFLLCPAVLR